MIRLHEVPAKVTDLLRNVAYECYLVQEQPRVVIKITARNPDDCMKLANKIIRMDEEHS